MNQIEGRQVPVPPSKSTTKSAGAFVRRRWPLAAAFLVLLSSGSVMIGGESGAALAVALEDPLALLADRSPGARPEGALFSTKPGKVVQDAVDSVLPLARASAPPAEDAPVSDGSIRFLASDPLAPVEVGPPPAAPVPEGPIPGSPGGSYSGGGTPGFIVPVGPGSGPPPECCDPDPPVDPKPPVVPAVPEPSTWAMMLLGFFMLGSALRARPRKVAVQAAI